MNRLIFAYIFILSCILCACQEVDDFPTSAGKVDADFISLDVTVIDNVKSDNPTSRATDNGMNTYFEPGDSVGLIVIDKKGDLIVNNAMYSLSDKFEWKYKGEGINTPCYDVEMQTYIVYYPYSELVTEENCKSTEQLMSLDVFKQQDDQSTEEAFRSSDLMVWELSGGPMKKLNAELRHMRNSISLDVSVQWQLLTDEIITFKISQGAAIRDKDGHALNTYLADDGTFRYILPDGYEGEITYFYTYRELMFKGAFEIQPSVTGTLYPKYETVDMGVYTFDKVIVGDFYCKNSDNFGFALPYEAPDYLDDNDHRCIGLVFYTGQHVYDGDENSINYDYKETGIDDNSCHGYVMALTDVQNDLANAFEWELDDAYHPYNREETRARMGVNTYPEDWGGYYNTHKVLENCDNFGWYTNYYPAVYAAYYYGNLATGTIEVYDPKTRKMYDKTILFNTRDNTPSGGERDEENPYAWQAPLQAPDNTTGWYLPGNGQITAFKSCQSLFEQRYEEIKAKLSDDVPYKEHIGWVVYKETGRGCPYYWSSTETNYDDRAFSHEYSREEYNYPSLKFETLPVRPVLGF